ILPLAGGRAVACEALVRWHPDGAAEGNLDELLPAAFLPPAGDSELIVQIGDWVLHTACAQAAAWSREGTSIPVCVNVAARQLTAVDLAERVRENLQRFHLPGRALCLEVSEDAVLRDPERARATLVELTRLGVAIALDNFGADDATTRYKRAAARAAAEMVREGMRLGLGTGSTVAQLLPALAARELHDLTCVATSPETERAARDVGLTVRSLDDVGELDMAIDGADQIDPQGWLVKGRGAAHTREKIVAAAARQFVVIASAEKAVPRLHPPVPLELI